MGLQTHTNDSTASNANAASYNSTQASAQPPQPSAASLPPEALDLAAKLFDMARAGDTAQLMPYVDAGIPPNMTNATGDTLLMLAAYHGHAETVEMLARRGADVNAVNGRGQSPLAGAVFKGHEGVVRALRDAGADRDAGRPSAVQTARMFKRQTCCDLLGVDMEGEVGISPGMVPSRPAGTS